MKDEKIEPTYKKGDLVHLETFNVMSVFEEPEMKIGIIVSDPYYDNNYTYNDWICYDEPIYDIQFPDEKRTGLPQNFLTKIETKKEKS